MHNLYAWGSNLYGQLALPLQQTLDFGGDVGKQQVSYYTSPTLVNGVDLFQISSQFYHTLGFDKDGVLWAWGDNKSDKLGTKQMEPIVTTPHQVKIQGPEGTNPRVTAVATGLEHSLCIANGVLYGWGSDTVGQTGVETIDTMATIKEPRQAWTNHAKGSRSIS